MYSTSHEFEDEVRRIARFLWPDAAFGGAEMNDGREGDGTFETEEYVHFIECTTSKTKDKAIKDCEKLEKLLRKAGGRVPHKFAKGWFITRDEPHAEQREVVKKYHGKIVICSFDQFRAQLVDARSYLNLRFKAPFGSVRNPATGSAEFAVEYVPLGIVDDRGTSYSVEEVIARLDRGERFVLTGDYGAGKSSTAREIFSNRGKALWQNRSAAFTLMLNLREHHGQKDPVEAIERHARGIGFSSPSSLVRAWRAGFCHVILDGFDEIASAGWAGTTKRLRDLRYRSMELLREFIRQTPRSSGILITGREHYFDSPQELRVALALPENHPSLKLQEFTPSQVRDFLAKLGWSDGVPAWLPTRPLLLAYLASNELLKPDTIGDVSVPPSRGWHELLERISQRESEIEAGLDPGTIRLLIERLATKARGSLDGIGPLSSDVIRETFIELCGYAPDDRGAVLLQRLPGLGGVSAEDGSRVFIDQDYVEAARAGDVFRFCDDPFGNALDGQRWESAMRPVGIGVASYRCSLAGHSRGKLNAALMAAYDGEMQALCLDIALVMTENGYAPGDKPLYLKELSCESLVVEEGLNLSNLELQDSIVGRLELGVSLPPETCPVFRRCHFGRIEGRTGMKDLPKDKFPDCTVDEFELGNQTTNAILNLPLPLTVKVLLTILKKLFAQSGTGRKESALKRGLDAKGQSVVPSVLELIRKHGFAVRTKMQDDVVWLPSKGDGCRARALSMLSGPMTSKDKLIEEAKDL